MKTSDSIAALGVLGTWFIAALALWGEWFRSWFPFLQPELSIEKTDGLVLVPQNNDRKARYYNVRVKNTRFSPAHQVRLFITRIEEPNAAGQPTPVFSEEVQLTWVRQEILPLAPDIGRNAKADASLLYVRDDGVFSFMPLVFPNHFPQPPSGPVDFWVTLQARSLETESKPVRLKIAWNGQWHSGEKEIGANLDVAWQI